MRLLFLGVLAALASAGHSQAQARFDFRGAQMGMSIEDLRALPPPTQLFHPATIACSSDEPVPRWVNYRSTSSMSGGVVICEFTDPQGNPVGQKIGASEITGATFSFFRGKLFSVELIAVDLALDTFKEGLTAKYGKPQTVTAGEAHSGAGGTFPRISLKWETAHDIIEVEAPALRTDRMMVIYLEKSAAALVESARKAERGSADKL